MTWLGLRRDDKPAIHAVKTCVIDLIKLPFLYPIVCRFVCLCRCKCVCGCVAVCVHAYVVQASSVPRACFVYCLLFEQTDKQIGLRDGGRESESGRDLGLVYGACWHSDPVRLFTGRRSCCCRPHFVVAAAARFAV